MAARTITGTIYHPGTNTAWPNAAVIVALLAPFTAGSTTYPAEKHTATTDSGGAFSLTVAVPASGTAAYKITLPDGTTTTVNLASGASVDLATLLSIPTSAVAESSLVTAIAAEAALRAAADTTLQTNITSEATARAAADTAHAALTTSAHGGLVPSTRTLAINGASYDLSADRTWTVTAGQGVVTTTADNTGATDATTQLRADIATAAATGHRRLYLPAGTYKIQKTTAGDMFAISADNFELFGDGPGKTILKWADNLSFGASVDIYTITFSGKHQSIHGLTLNGGTGQTLNGATPNGILFGDGAQYGYAYDLEITNMNGATGAGAFGIGSYMSWNTNEINITLGTAVASAGSATITPSSMNGIYLGRRMLIGGASPEQVVVTATTATTFTATFANTHLSTDYLRAYTQGRTYHVFDRIHVHDCPLAHGIGVGSSATTVRNCRIERVGLTSLQHGMYIQGGANKILDNFVSGSGGYNFHMHKQFPEHESSGDYIAGNYSLDPKTAHLVSDLLTSGGTNAEVPSGQSLNRYATIVGNVFRNTNQHDSSTIRLNGPATAFIGNTLEDFCNGDGAGWVDMPDGGTTQSIVANNVFRWTNPKTTGLNYTAIRANGGIVEGNRFEVGSGFASCISIYGGGVARGNHIIIGSGSTGGTVIQASGDGAVVDGNVIITASNAVKPLAIGAGLGMTFRNNVIRYTGAGTLTSSPDDWTNTTALFQANTLSAYRLRYTGTITGITFRDNDMPAPTNGSATIAITTGAGQLATWPVTAAAITEGRLVKLSSGQIAQLGTSDTSALGVAALAIGAGNAGTAIHVVDKPGAIVPIACDGAWTIGNIGVPSTTSAGKIHDSGLATAPASGSYVLFLDTGGSAGDARCMLVKTL